jgi:uncharacterized membrane protein YsdA (DUF1294 family)
VLRRIAPRSTFMTAAIILLLAVAGCLFTPLDFLVAWLISANLAAFGLYAYDKASASRRLLRVPEGTLLAVAVLGGTPGAALGMALLRHKVTKRVFQARFWGIAGLQAALIMGYNLWRLLSQQT